VTDGKAHRDDCIGKFIQGLHGTPNGKFTIRDLLSHRSGLCRSDGLLFGSDSRLILTKSQGIDFFAQLGAARPPRQGFLYNNFGYHVVGCVIVQVSSMNYSKLLAQCISRPLDTDRTFTKPPPNIRPEYCKGLLDVPYCNLQLREVSPRMSDDTVAFSAEGARSCMRDFLIFYAALLRKFTMLTPEPVLGDAALGAILGAAIPLPASTSFREQSYGMGLARTQLPSVLSNKLF